MLLHTDSFWLKFLSLLPRRLVWIEQARVGTDCIHWFRVYFIKP